MTEYWVSQGNKWCDFCKIYIANNPLSIRTHELGQRHKDSVAKRLDSMRKEGAAKEKEQKEAARALEQIEAKAKRSYQKDLAAFRDTRDSNALAFEACRKIPENAKKWEYDATSGYYYNQANGIHYDPNSGLYYSAAIGKWVTEEEAFSSSKLSSSLDSRNSNASNSRKPSSTSEATLTAEDKGATQNQSGPPPGLVVPSSLNPMRSVKGAPSSVAVNKRKRVDEKPKVMSKEEAAALKAREAAKKRMEEREKPLLGLYKSY
ncbi:zinc finger protein ZOP1 [Cinnamomum micranthum f. kanehirae]|uniref:Zinc finger protein ZOP1 n=1 Tax=Cinnamomum micranthum f. kanehirae TaxID=337451 RepID=A0A443PGV1_9MAGN|nr:zinc finger protein ZOP1 [Cinnamomum micranthum f. kanehirae]